MTLHPAWPLREQVALDDLCIQPAHAGQARIATHGELDDSEHPLVKLAQHFNKAPPINEWRIDGSFFLPEGSHCVFRLHPPDNLNLSQQFGRGLTIEGNSVDGPFVLHCPHYHVCETSDKTDDRTWAIATAMNEPVTINYSPMRPIARVVAHLNNFDFECGNSPPERPGSRLTTLRVAPLGRNVEFTWRPERRALRNLVRAGFLQTAAFCTASFDAWPDATESELIEFADNVASLAGIVVQQQTGIPLLSFLDTEGRAVKRVIRNPIISAFRNECILAIPHHPTGLPALYAECFEQHVELRHSKLWHRFPSYLFTIEDAPFLEQRYASLMAAVELLIRNSLIEVGESPDSISQTTLVPLIKMARSRLNWDFPDHYTADNVFSTIRNKVAHGDDLPTDIATLRGQFDKWRLFAVRRFLIRLGYDGEVVSPYKGWKSESPVDDFSEERNTFG